MEKLPIEKSGKLLPSGGSIYIHTYKDIYIRRKKKEETILLRLVFFAGKKRGEEILFETCFGGNWGGPTPKTNTRREPQKNTLPHDGQTTTNTGNTNPSKLSRDDDNDGDDNNKSDKQHIVFHYRLRGNTRQTNK